MKHLAWLVLVGCVPTSWDTEAEHYIVSDGGLAQLGSPGPILAGTEVCPTLTCRGDECPVFEDTDVAIDECVAWEFEGDVIDEADGCFTLGTAGEAVWTIAPTDCAVAGTLLEDRVVFEVVDPAQVEAMLPQRGEELVEEAAAGGAIVGEVPMDWRQPTDEPWRIVAGSPFGLYPRLVDDGARSVVWRAQDAAIVATVIAGDAPSLVYDRADGVTLTLRAGAEASLALETGGAAFPLAEVVGVDVSEAASLTIFALVYDMAPSGTEATMPMGARAIVRDADGHLLFGAPVEWEVTGAVQSVFEQSEYTPGPDYVSLGDTCPAAWPRKITRAATLTATLGDLSATTRLEWSPGVDPDAEIPADVDPACRNACGCASTGGGALAPAMAAVFALLLSARRRAR